MTDAMKERLEVVIQAVFNSPTGECCRNCIIREVVQQCRMEGLRVSRLNIAHRVKAIIKASWDEPDTPECIVN